MKLLLQKIYLALLNELNVFINPSSAEIGRDLEIAVTIFILFTT